MNRKPSKDFYRTVITKSLLPFWDKAVDRGAGGIFTCFDNSGKKLLSKDKYTWSQGRFLWMWSRLIENIRKGNIPEGETGALSRYEEDARRTAAFLDSRAFAENGNVIFLLSESGKPKVSVPGAPLDASIYADCFVCMGFSEYALVFGEERYAERALKLYRNILARVETGKFNTEPYPVPAGCAMHGIPMFAMYTGSEAARALSALGMRESAEIAALAGKYAGILEKDFFAGPYNIEVKGPESMSDTLLARHITPGHTAECLWFYIHFMEFLGRKNFLPLGDTIGRWALEHGWDKEQGGIFRFIDREGGEPRGRLIDDPYEKLIRKTWDTKLWWVHSESLYFSALMARRMEEAGDKAGSSFWQGMYEKIFDYTFDTFPNPDASVGEWVQIRCRDGSPLDEVVALPVKDPYHIFRNMLLLLEL
jgi:N-acylglucosamine 2-epimerase